MKRHARPYGCTFLACNQTFGSKNDWKRHENAQHFQLETWRCDEQNPEGRPCARVCYRKQTFQEHINKNHQVLNEEDVKKKVETCRMGRNCQGRFWCGFCTRIVELKEKGLAAWTERFDHIDDHFMGRHGLDKQSIQEWIPVDGDKPKGSHGHGLDHSGEEKAYSPESSPDIQESQSDIYRSSTSYNALPKKEVETLGQSTIIRNHQAWKIKGMQQVSITAIYCCQCHIAHDPNINQSCTHCDNHTWCPFCRLEIFERPKTLQDEKLHDGTPSKPSFNLSNIPFGYTDSEKPGKSLPASDNASWNSGSIKDQSYSNEEIKNINQEDISPAKDNQKRIEDHFLSSTSPQSSTKETDLAKALPDTKTKDNPETTRTSSTNTSRTNPADSKDSDTHDKVSGSLRYSHNLLWLSYTCSRSLSMIHNFIKRSPLAMDAKSYKILRACSESLFLWSDGFQASDLDLLARWSAHLSQTMTRFLVEIGRDIMDVLCAVVPDSEEEHSLRYEVKHLKCILWEMEYIFQEMERCGIEEKQGDGLKGEKAVAISVVGDKIATKWEEEAKDHSARCPKDYLAEIVLNIDTAVQCLMDLIPSIELVINTPI